RLEQNFELLVLFQPFSFKVFSSSYPHFPIKNFSFLDHPCFFKATDFEFIRQTQNFGAAKHTTIQKQ
ncbi:MAG: hypothetical protein L0J44_04045, partial [Tetragenococcus koreensis]|nr:hypothetical protein [Tetragenococcus koreensis]